MEHASPGEQQVTRIAVMVGKRGRGSNMRAILAACRSGKIPAVGALVVAPVPDVPAVDAAEKLGAAVEVISPDEPDYASRLLAVLRENEIALLCLAGFMRLLPEEIVRTFPDAILNIHPALLPKFGGKGMYGIHVHEAVLAAGETETGCTVHFVNERYDEGAVFHQLRCPVEPNDTPLSLAARVLDLEHRCYIEAINKWIDNYRQPAPG